VPIYGNWCGPGYGSGTPVDQIDDACRIHDQCQLNFALAKNLALVCVLILFSFRLQKVRKCFFFFLPSFLMRCFEEMDILIAAAIAG
jgi:hypothetical protein